MNNSSCNVCKREIAIIEKVSKKRSNKICYDCATSRAICNKDASILLLNTDNKTKYYFSQYSFYDIDEFDEKDQLEITEYYKISANP